MSLLKYWSAKRAQNTDGREKNETRITMYNGWLGINNDPKTQQYDATKLAPPVNVDRLKKKKNIPRFTPTANMSASTRSNGQFRSRTP